MKTPNHILLLGILLLAVTIGHLPISASADESRLRVAMLDFTTDDNSYPSMMIGAGLAAAAQAELAGSERWMWVERRDLKTAFSELKLSKFGMLDPKSALRVGKWLKADVLVLGGFRRDGQENRTLHLEAVDLARADVLAVRDLPWGPGELKLEPADIERTADAVKSALEEAERRLGELKGKTIIASLFFSNTSKERRLDFFENDLQEALAKASEGKDVHILRFPKASEAFGESELAVLGLAEHDPDSWESVADCYVWGEFSERDSYSGAFEEVVIDAVIHVWDGHREPVILKESGKAGDLDALASGLADGILSAVHRRSAERPDKGVRQQLADQLLNRVRNIRAKYGTWDKTTISPEFRCAWERAIRILETVCFIMPEKAAAHWELLMTKWNIFIHIVIHLNSVSRLAQAREFGEFVDRFGVEAMNIRPDAWTNYSDFRQQYITSAFYALLFGLDSPNGMPEELYGQWRDEVEADFFKRIMTINYQEAYYYLSERVLHNPQRRVKILKMVWPSLIKTEHPGIRSMPWEQIVRQACKEAGIPEQAEQILKQGLPSPPVPPRYWSEEEKRFGVPRLDLLPPKLECVFRPLQLPNDECSHVTTVAYYGDRLWISAQGRLTDTWRYPSLLAHLFYEYQTNMIWVVDPVNGEWTEISGRLGISSRATAFCPAGGWIWIATRYDGLWQVEPESYGATHFGHRDGLLSPEVYCIARSGNKMFAGGGPIGSGKLSVQQQSSGAWQGVEGRQDVRRITHLAGFGDLLLVCAGHRWHVWMIDVNTGRTFDPPVYRFLQNISRHLETMQIAASVTDSRGFWLGIWPGLIRFEPNTGCVEEYLSQTGLDYDRYENFPRLRVQGRIIPSFLPTSRILGGVTALVDDGEFLWIGVTTDNAAEFLPSPVDGNYVMLWHKTSSRWVGALGFENRITSMTASDKKLWIGFGSPMQYESGSSLSTLIVEVEKEPLLKTPRDQWVSDDISQEELDAALAVLPRRIQARYAFLLGDYAKAVELLEHEPEDIDSLFMLAYSHDPLGLNKPEIAETYFQAIIDRYPESLWVKEAEQQIQSLERNE